MKGVLGNALFCGLRIVGFFGKPQNDKADYAARDFHGTALPRLGITKEKGNARNGGAE